MVDFWLPVLVFVGSSLILVKAGSLAVKNILELAKSLSFSDFIASFVIAGAVSILPEFFVGINSALEGVTDVGIGTLIGNNIVDLTLVMGILVILGRNIPASGLNKMTTLPFLGAVALPLGLMLDGVITRFDGVLLVVGAVVYFYWMVTRETGNQKKVKRDWRIVFPQMAVFIFFMIIIFFSSKFVVESGVELAHIFGFPEIFAGLFLISLGAALPELTFSMNAIFSRHKTIALADILGNVALDSLFSIGVMAIIVPVPIQLGIIGISALFMVFAALLMTTYLNNDGKLTRRDGIALIGLYIVFVVVQFTINGLMQPNSLPPPEIV